MAGPMEVGKRKPRRAGTIKAKAAGVWFVRVYVGRDADGKRRYHSRTVKGTRREAEAYVGKLVNQVAEGQYREPSRQTLAAWLEHWLQHAVKAQVRSRTHRDYENITKRYIRPEIGGVRLDRLTSKHVERFYSTLTARGIGARSVRYAHSVLHAALEHAVRHGELSRNPAARVRPPKLVRREMRALEPAEAARFLQHAEEAPYGAYFILLLMTGLRPGEALALRWSDIDGDRLRVQRNLVFRNRRSYTFEEPKTSRSRRVVVMPSVAVRALQRQRAHQAAQRLAAGEAYEDQGLVFATPKGEPLDQLKVQRGFPQLLERAELPRIRIYDLRHSCATLLLAAGEGLKVVSERLGHSSIVLTADVYAHVSEEMQQRAAEKLDALLSASGMP